VRVDGQKLGIRRERRTSGRLTAKSISIKDAKRRSGDCARKAAELTPGGLSCVARATEVVERQSDRKAEVSRGRSRSSRRQGFQGTPSRCSGSSCSLGFDGDKFVAQLFGSSFEFCFQPFLPLGVSGVPDGLVIFDLVFYHGVKDHCDLVGGCHGGSFGAQLGFHSAQVVS
jgi:hypothetical protein